MNSDRLAALMVKLSLWVVAVFVLSGPNAASAQESISWTHKPAYETPLKDTDSTAFSVPDSDNVQHVFYDQSHAILIIEGAYSRGGWARVSDSAKRNEGLLRESLEKRGFDVLAWHDLTGAQLRTTLTEVFSNFGYRQNTRLFFYYYGHGQVMGTDSDPVAPKAFLVPVDAPNPVTDEQEFYRIALPLTQIVEFAKEITVKHAFFALEACQAGSIIASLSGLPPPYPKGYLLGTKIQRPIRQFLTAGSIEEDVLADSPFAPLLVAAFEEGDSNKDGYVTGSEVVEYVTLHVPQNSQFQNPEHGSIPIGGGDMVFGPVSADIHTPLPAPTVVTKEEIVTRVWRSPELSVDCNRTNSARIQASVPLDPNYSEKVLSVTARYEGTAKIKDATGPTVEGPPSPTVVVKYGFNGLDKNIVGDCPGGRPRNDSRRIQGAATNATSARAAEGSENGSSIVPCCPVFFTFSICGSSQTTLRH